MQSEWQLLMVTAVTIAFLHTLTGPDHYIPFIVLSKARKWSIGKTIGWTLLCGCGHVWSSVLLALIGAAVGWSISTLTWFQGLRGGLASWALLCFGFIYTTWGLYRARQNLRHKHFDVQADGNMIVYEHKEGEWVAPRDRQPVTPWVMFLIFVLGPCEPMIPLLYFPAAKDAWWGVGLIIMVYTLCTLCAMLIMVLFGYYGLRLFNTASIEKYFHALAGFSIFLCGAAMVFLEW